MKILLFIVSISFTAVFANPKDNQQSKFHLPGAMHHENLSQMMHDDPYGDLSNSLLHDPLNSEERPINPFIDHDENDPFAVGRDMIWLQSSNLYQDWDGSAYVNDYRYQYTYDDNNNRTEYTRQDWDGAAWVNDWRDLYTYDDNNNMTERTRQDWDGAAWVNDWRYLETYNAYNDYTGSTRQDWDGAVWVNDSKSTYTWNYDNTWSYPQYEELLYQDWDGAAWVNTNRYTDFSYNDNNPPRYTEYTNQDWDGTAWVNNYRNQFIHDDNNNRTVFTNQDWDGAAWEDDYRYLYTYDDNNNRTVYTNQDWDGAAWEDDFRYLYTYDANNNMTEDTRQDWDGAAWVNDRRYLYTYDANNNMTEYTSQDWDGAAWVNDRRDLYTFDANNNRIEQTNQDWDGAAWVNDSRITSTYISGNNVFHVSTTGSDETGDGTEANPFATIQTAIDSSEDGDHVSVAAGTYVENIYIDKNIAVLGEDRETTIIDGDSSGSVVTFGNSVNETALFSGFTITNGSGLMEDDPSNNWDNGLSKGGGIYLDESSPILEQLIIENNTVSGGGGGISKSSQNSSLHISHSLVRNNTAKYAGAIHGQNGSNVIMYCEIYNNHATNIAGGFGGVMSVSNTSIYNNTAVDGAAAMSADATMFNCVVSGNESPNYCIEIGGGSTEIENTIIWGNTSASILCWSGIAISYSNIEGGQDSFLDDGTAPNWGEGNIDANPRFCEPDSGDFSLAENSPSAGTGEDGSNMGAFDVECGDQSLVHSVPNDYSTIQSAIDESLDGDVVMVQNGTYLENINFEGKGITVTSVTGPDSTIIDGGGADIVVTFDSNEDENSVLTGFTITNGSARQPWPYNRGGGINCQNSSPRMFDLIITGNTGEGGGGGVYIKNASPEMHYCDITDNVAGWNGGGIYIEGVNQGYSAYFHQVDIRGNTGSAGGGVQVQNSNPTFEFVEVSGNTGNVGGGIHFEQSQAELAHVTIVNNTAQTGGGIQLKENYSDISSEVRMENSIVWGNEPQQIYFHEDGEPNYMYIHYSDIEGGYDDIEFNDNGDLLESEGNIDADPLFCDVDDGNFGLAENSPCLNIDWNSQDYMGAHGLGCGLLDSELPAILSIEDVPEDQGNWVYIEFSSSIHDADDEGPLGTYTIERQDGEEWVSLHSISAYGADSYITEAHTLMDSTGEDNGMTSFRVVAAMEVGALISNSAEGYSVDNIAPGVPTGLMASVSSEGIHLSWDMSTAEDFQYFVLEKSNTADFSDYQMIETIDTSYLDMDYQVESTVYYRLQAFDDGGNVSDYSEVVDMTVLWTDLGIAIPDEYAIHQNYPNPFNPVTTLRYDLPEQAFVNIQIYDMLGRKVRTIVNEQQNPGYKSILWNAKDDYGTAVSAGLYIYQVHAGNFIQTKKMILVK
mgnify:CR=1 FL=1